MKKLVILLVLSACLAAEGAAPEVPLANAGRKGLQAKTIDEMLALPDEEIDIGLGALLIGKEYDPDLDIPKYLAQLDQMARELRARIGGKKDPREVIHTINKYVFEEQGFITVEGGRRLAKPAFLHILLEENKGPPSCVVSLCLALSERISQPLTAAIVPGHVFLRYVSNGTGINMETKNAGASLPDSYYIQTYRVPETAVGRVSYMKNLTKKQSLGILLADLGSRLAERGDFEPAATACRKALKLIPGAAGTWALLADTLEREGNL